MRNKGVTVTNASNVTSPANTANSGLADGQGSALGQSSEATGNKGQVTMDHTTTLRIQENRQRALEKKAALTLPLENLKRETLPDKLLLQRAKAERAAISQTSSVPVLPPTMPSEHTYDKSSPRPREQRARSSRDKLPPLPTPAPIENFPATPKKIFKQSHQRQSKPPDLSTQDEEYPGTGPKI